MTVMFTDLLTRLMGGATKAEHYQLIIDGQPVLARAGSTILEAALDHGITLPYSCQVGACGECQCRVSGGSYRTLRNLSYMFSPDELAKGTTLACQTVPTSHLEVTVCGQDIWRRGAVEAIRDLGGNIVEVSVSLARPHLYRCGDTVDLRAPDTRLIRPYSVVNHPDKGDERLVFHVKLRPGGRMSAWWGERTVNTPAAIDVGPPRPGLSLEGEEPVQRLVCVAGGSAMGVVAGLARDWARSRPGGKCVIIAVNRQALSVYHRHVIAEIRQFTDLELTVWNVPFRSWCADGDGRDSVGISMPPPANSRALICGSRLVVNSACRHFERAGWKREQLCHQVF